MLRAGRLSVRGNIKAGLYLVEIKILRTLSLKQNPKRWEYIIWTPSINADYAGYSYCYRMNCMKLKSIILNYGFSIGSLPLSISIRFLQLEWSSLQSFFVKLISLFDRPHNSFHITQSIKRSVSRVLCDFIEYRCAQCRYHYRLIT